MAVVSYLLLETHCGEGTNTVVGTEIMEVDGGNRSHAGSRVNYHSVSPKRSYLICEPRSTFTLIH